jgi:hypothetical protein
MIPEWFSLINWKMATMWFSCSNVSLPLPSIFEYLLNGFDHNTQEKFEFGYNVFYGSRGPSSIWKMTILVVFEL